MSSLTIIISSLSEKSPSSKNTLSRLEADKARTETKRSGHLAATLKNWAANRVIDPKVADQFTGGRLLAYD